METNTKPRYICRFKDENDCISYGWKEVNMETNMETNMKTYMKIDVEESIIYKFDSKTDLSQAVLALGEKGYFSDDEKFIDYVYDTLTEVKCLLEEAKFPFVRCNNKGIKIDYLYFIPEDAVAFKEEEPKKLRPYKDISEFCNETGCEEVGENLLTIRDKKDKQEKVLLFTGYSETAVHLGAYLITFNGLLCDCEFLYDGEWCPFGIEE